MMARVTETPDRLIRTAAELFASQGYGQTGVTQIMEQAQATAGSFYHFFPAKQDLLLAVVDHLAATMESECFPSSDDDVDPVSRVFALFRFYRKRLLESRFKVGSPFGTLAAELSESHPKVREQIARHTEGLESRVESLLRKAKVASGRGRDARSLAQFVLATLEGAALRARLGRSIDSFDASADQLQSFLSTWPSDSRTTTSSRATTESRPRSREPVRDWRAW